MAPPLPCRTTAAHQGPMPHPRRCRAGRPSPDVPNRIVPRLAQIDAGAPDVVLDIIPFVASSCLGHWVVGDDRVRRTAHETDGDDGAGRGSAPDARACTAPSSRSGGQRIRPTRPAVVVRASWCGPTGPGRCTSTLCGGRCRRGRRPGGDQPCRRHPHARRATPHAHAGGAVGPGGRRRTCRPGDRTCAAQHPLPDVVPALGAEEGWGLREPIVPDRAGTGSAPANGQQARSGPSSDRGVRSGESSLGRGDGRGLGTVAAGARSGVLAVRVSGASGHPCAQAA